MNVSIQMKLPVKFIQALNEKMIKVKEVHAQELKRAAKLDPKKLAALNERAKKLTIQGMVRAILTHGMDAKPDEIVKALDADDIARGRPRGKR